MSVANSKPTKTVKRNRPVGNGNKPNDEGLNFDTIRYRLFAPKRKSVTFNLDLNIIGEVDLYEEYLTEKYGETPLKDAVAEVLLESGLKQPEFQIWLKNKQTGKVKTEIGLINEEEAENLLDDALAVGNGKSS